MKFTTPQGFQTKNTWFGGALQVAAANDTFWTCTGAAGTGPGGLGRLQSIADNWRGYMKIIPVLRHTYWVHPFNEPFKGKKNTWKLSRNDTGTFWPFLDVSVSARWEHVISNQLRQFLPGVSIRKLSGIYNCIHTFHLIFWNISSHLLGWPPR